MAHYLNLGATGGPQWSGKDLFLENRVPCVTNYHAVFNSRSIFRDWEVKGIVFDDAHLSLDLIDEQFALRIEDNALAKRITDLFKTSPVVTEKIEALQSGDPLPLIMIPPLDWHQQAASVKTLLSANDTVRNSLQWLNLKDKLDKAFCFASARRVEISLLYPDVRSHFAFRPDIHRVYLSATLPNLDDITRVFGITPSRIETNNPDYRPQRLFVFSSKLKFDGAEDAIRGNLSVLSPKTFVLVPSRDATEQYKQLGATVPANSSEVIGKIEEFKHATRGILALANRYDGIDLPGGTCHSLLLDGLPYTGTLKTKFFSEYFHNHHNAFLRSIIASKLIQAFGRTIRANDDYSVIFLLGDRLNSWVVNRDNRRFFKRDIAEDIEIGASVSETVADIDDLKELVSAILNQTDEWKGFYEERKSAVEAQDSISKRDEENAVSLAQEERKVHDLFLAGKYADCLQKILSIDASLGNHSKPLLGLYLSIAAVCCLETGDDRLHDLSARAYGINPIFGMPVTTGVRRRSWQAQRIVDLKKPTLSFDWTAEGKSFDQNLKELGDALGFDARRPELEGDGTLDVLWEDEEKKFVIGFECKIGKTNKQLSKSNIDQCSGHENWLQRTYPDYEAILFTVGNFESRNRLASPSQDLSYLKVPEIQRIAEFVSKIHGLKTYPEQIDPFLDENRLRIDLIFSRSKVVDLPAGKA